MANQNFVFLDDKSLTIEEVINVAEKKYSAGSAKGTDVTPSPPLLASAAPLFSRSLPDEQHPPHD